MIFEFDNYKIDIDIEKTKNFYNRAEKITASCDCQGCRNYEKWAELPDSEPSQILKRMGIMMEKASEVYINCPNEDDSVLYGGFYHICGSILQGCQVWDKSSENHGTLSQMSFVDLCDGFQVAFTGDATLLEKDFPKPVIQMEILANTPWLLSEPLDF